MMENIRNRRILKVIVILTAAGLVLYFNHILQSENKESFTLPVSHDDEDGVIDVVEEEKQGDRVAYLTFDDGPSEHTEKILDILKEHDVKATFFVNGNDTPFGRRMYRRIVKEGHALGNHTYSHNYRNIYKSSDSFWKDVFKLEELLEKTTGVKPRIIRFPGGSTNTVARSVSGYNLMEDLMQEVTDAGYIYMDWNVCAFDAYNPPPSPVTIAANVLNQSKSKDLACILLHDSEFNSTTPGALPRIIEGLRDMGFYFDIVTYDTGSIKFY